MRRLALEATRDPEPPIARTRALRAACVIRCPSNSCAFLTGARIGRRQAHLSAGCHIPLRGCHSEAVLPPAGPRILPAAAASRPIPSHPRPRGARDRKYPLLTGYAAHSRIETSAWRPSCSSATTVPSSPPSSPLLSAHPVAPPADAPQESLRTSVRPLELLYCLDNMRLGGSELNAVRTAEQLDRGRFRVTVACLSDDGPLTARYRAAGVSVIRFPVTSLYGVSAVRQGIALARFIAEKKIDIVHSHDMYSNVFAAPWARLARRPVLITSRRWWHSLPNAKLRLANTVAFRLSHCVLANSRAVAGSVRDSDHIAADRIAVVPNFADDSAFLEPSPAALAALRLELGVPQGAFVVGVVARLVPVKDHATLLRAVAQLWSKHSSVHLVLVGDGPEAGPLRKLASELGLTDSITFAGERAGGINCHRLFDVSVLSSLSEGFPNTIVEAMAAARPVVATAVGGNEDAVVAGSTGILVQPGSPEQLADAISQLVENPEIGIAMGARGQQRAHAEFGAGRAISALESLYERLASRVVA